MSGHHRRPWFGILTSMGLLFSVLPPPIVHHRWCDLFGIANWPWLRFNQLMPTLAGTALGVADLIRTDATSEVPGLAFLHDLLADARVR